MKQALIFLLIVIPNFTFSQTIIEIDSVSNNMCEYLKTLEIKNDTLKINTLYENRLYPYIDILEESNVQKSGQLIFYRLQRNCVEFRMLLDRLDPPKEVVKRKKNKPKSKISKRELKEFKKRSTFYYYEVEGEKTSVTMNKKIWLDTFSNNTFSKLNYKWINKNEFELIFIESNNESRSSISVKGDKYIYQVLSKEKDYYSMSLNIPGQKVYELFKLYFK
jgi:hypothetical protein